VGGSDSGGNIENKVREPGRGYAARRTSATGKTASLSVNESTFVCQIPPDTKAQRTRFIVNQIRV